MAICKLCSKLHWCLIIKQTMSSAIPASSLIGLHWHSLMPMDMAKVFLSNHKQLYWNGPKTLLSHHVQKNTAVQILFFFSFYLALCLLIVQISIASESLRKDLSRVRIKIIRLYAAILDTLDSFTFSLWRTTCCTLDCSSWICFPVYRAIKMLFGIIKYFL